MCQSRVEDLGIMLKLLVCNILNISPSRSEFETEPRYCKANRQPEMGCPSATPCQTKWNWLKAGEQECCKEIRRSNCSRLAAAGEPGQCWCNVQSAGGVVDSANTGKSLFPSASRRPARWPRRATHFPDRLFVPDRAMRLLKSPLPISRGRLGF